MHTPLQLWDFFSVKKIKYQHINMYSKHQKIFKWRQLETYSCVLYLYMCNFQFSKTDNNFPKKIPTFLYLFCFYCHCRRGSRYFSEYWVFVKACINCLLVIIHVFNTSSHCCPVTRCFENMEMICTDVSLFTIKCTWTLRGTTQNLAKFDSCIYICIDGSNKVEKYLR